MVLGRADPLDIGVVLRKVREKVMRAVAALAFALVASATPATAAPSETSLIQRASARCVGRNVGAAVVCEELPISPNGRPI